MKFYAADSQLAWASSQRSYGPESGKFLALEGGVRWILQEPLSLRHGAALLQAIFKTKFHCSNGCTWDTDEVSWHEYFTEHCYRLFPGTHRLGFEYICDIYLLQQKSHCYRFLYKYLMVSSHKLNLNNNSTNDIKAFHSFQKSEEKSKYLHTAF